MPSAPVYLYLLTQRERRWVGTTTLVERPESKLKDELLPLNEPSMTGIFKISKVVEFEVAASPAYKFYLRPRRHLVALRLARVGDHRFTRSKVVVWFRDNLPEVGEIIAVDNKNGTLIRVQEMTKIATGVDVAEFLLRYEVP